MMMTGGKAQGGTHVLLFNSGLRLLGLDLARAISPTQSMKERGFGVCLVGLSRTASPC